MVIQGLADEHHSGVGFSRDPRRETEPHAVIECVPGRRSDLVDGTVEPDRWLVEIGSGRVLGQRPSSDRSDGQQPPDDGDLAHLGAMLKNAESLLKGPADVEWTGRGERLT